MSVTVFPVILGATQTGGGLGVILTGTPRTIVFIACICVAITLTPKIKKKTINPKE